MKKIIALVLCVLAVLSIAACVEKHRGFAVDGEIYSAVVNDGELVLDLKKEKKTDSWTIKDGPKLFAADYFTEHDDLVEFHIISLNAGSDTVTVVRTAEDGSEEAYKLTVKISRNGKTQLLIDSVDFVKAG